MFSRNIIVRLHVFFIVFCLALSTPLVYANTYNGAVNFFGFNNFSRQASGAVADFWFQNKNTAQVYAARAKFMTNTALGAVARSRILRLSPQALIVGFAVTEVITALQSEGWTVDTANQEIFKLTGGPQFFVSTQGFTNKRFGSETSAINDFINVKWANTTPKPVFTGFSTNWTKPISDLKVNEVAFRSFTLSQGSSTLTYTLGVEITPSSKQIATDADVGAVLPQVSDGQIQALVATPDYAKEPHPPTLAAAAAAGVAAPATEDCAGSSGTFNGAVFCISDAPAGIQDNLSGETGSAAGTSTGENAGIGTKTTTNTTTTANPDGSTTTTETTTTTNPDGTTTTQTKTTTTNPDGTTTTTTTGAKASDTPAFCVYAKTLCDWLNWTKQEPNPSTVSTVPDVSEIDLDPASKQTDFVTWSRSCPAPITSNINIANNSTDFDLSFEPLCDMLETARPIIVAFGWLSGLAIVVGIRDDQG